MPGSITVRLFHRLKELVGEKSVRISPVPYDIRTLIARLVEMFPAGSDELLGDDGELSRAYVVAINEDLLKRDGWGGVKLKDGDEVALLTIISGG